LIGLAALFALAGCKSNTTDNGSRSSDPLVSGGSRIPAQNIPLLDRGSLGSNGKSDPLLGSPPSKPVDKNGVGYSDDPARFKGTYIPSPSSTPAALAGNLKGDGEELKIDGNENRVPLQQTGAIVPVKSTGPGAAVESLYRELEKYGWMREERALGQENGEYVFRAAVPREGRSGAKIQITGVGQTPEEAIKKVLDQVIEDRK
jgi:hypothetical protein